MKISVWMDILLLTFYGYIGGYFYQNIFIIKSYSKFKDIFNHHIIIILQLEGMIILINF